MEPGLLLVVIAVAVAYFLFARARRPVPAKLRPEHDFAFECVSEPLARASPDFRAKFAERDLDRWAAIPDAHLVRFGLFNIGHVPITPSRFRKSLTLSFGGEAEILSATFAEALKNTAAAPDPAVASNRLTLPPFELDGGGTIIFNIVLRGSPRHPTVECDIEDIDVARRLG